MKRFTLYFKRFKDRFKILFSGKLEMENINSLYLYNQLNKYYRQLDMQNIVEIPQFTKKGKLVYIRYRPDYYKHNGK